MLISEAFDLYCLDRIVASGQSAKTEENHYVCLRALLQFFGDREIETLTRKDIRDWKISLDKSRSSATVRNYIVKLRVVLKHLRQEGYAVLDPDLIPVPKRIEKVPAYLTAEQVDVLINSTKRLKNKAIIALLYASGIRVSELCSLNRGDLKDGTFTVVGKGGYARLCFFDDRARIYIELYLESRKDNNQALFITDGGERIRPGVIQETFKSVRKASKLEANPHTMRHSFATNLMRNGMHIYELSRILGHKNIQTTSVYLHVTDPHLQDSYKKYHTI